MNLTRCLARAVLVLPMLLLFLCSLAAYSQAQDVPQLPSPGIMSGDGGYSHGSNAIPVSSGMLAPFLPKIPNLEMGFLYSFGKNVRTGRFTADYVLPFKLGCDSVLFGEAHGEGWDFWKRPSVSITTPVGFATTTSTSRSRVDLSFGGGYRTMLGDGMMLGANGFYDASRLYDKWYSSGGVGLEMAATVGGDDAVDLNFNWYGNLFNKDVLVNAFRNHGGSFDVEAGYSHALFDHALDLRLKFAGYQFDVGNAVYGWRGGADLTTRNGMFTLRYEHGSDRISGDYNTVGAFVTVGFQLENMLSGESPITMPEPVFRSPRDLRRLLGLKVKRNFHQPSSVILARTSDKPIILRIPAQSNLPFGYHFIPFTDGSSFTQAEFVAFQSITITSNGSFDRITGIYGIGLNWASSLPYSGQPPFLVPEDGQTLVDVTAPHDSSFVPPTGVAGLIIHPSFLPSTWDTPELIITIIP